MDVDEIEMVEAEVDYIIGLPEPNRSKTSS